jgi:mannose-1-phosphate guanylyltransferase
MRQGRVRALLLAAGLGTRLRPLTDQWPKCLMPIGKYPLLGYWLNTLRSNGIKDVVVNTHYHANEVNKFLFQKQFAGWVKPVHETELLGTAGTLRANSNFFLEHTTLLAHADNWCQCDFKAFVNYHFQQRPAHCLMTMMTFDTDSPQSCGIVETDDQNVVLAFHEKVLSPPGRRANAAVYLLQPELLKWLNDNPHVADFSTEVLPHFLGRIATWHNAGIHRDIGTLAALRAAQTDPMVEDYSFGNDEWQRAFESSSVFTKLIRTFSIQEYSNER